MTTLETPAVATREVAGRAVDAAISARGVERRYRGGRGVGPVDLRVAGGEVVVLMGPNGAGKTTLLRVLATVDRPQRGSVAWYGAADVAAARRSLGLSLDSTVEEATLSGLQSAHFWCRQWVGDAGVALQLCEDTLRRFGLWEMRNEPVGAYSYGMRRRLALVEALAHRPRLALLDEPTAGLDPTGVQALLAELRARSLAGAATVVASNDPNFSAAAADRVAFLMRGALVRCGTPAELLAAVGAARVAELRFADGGVSVGSSQDVPHDLDPGGGLLRLQGSANAERGGGLFGARATADAEPGVALSRVQGTADVEATGAQAVHLRALWQVPGVERVDAQPGGAVVRYRDPAALPRIVAAADRPGGRLRDLHVHEPDLGDAFRELTGERLGEEDRP
jgi:ABC-2 type transport system ATP-binding protein